MWTVYFQYVIIVFWVMCSAVQAFNITKLSQSNSHDKKKNASTIAAKIFSLNLKLLFIFFLCSVPYFLLGIQVFRYSPFFPIPLYLIWLIYFDTFIVQFTYDAIKNGINPISSIECKMMNSFTLIDLLESVVIKKAICEHKRAPSKYKRWIK